MRLQFYRPSIPHRSHQAKSKRTGDSRKELVLAKSSCLRVSIPWLVTSFRKAVRGGGWR